MILVIHTKREKVRVGRTHFPHNHGVLVNTLASLLSENARAPALAAGDDTVWYRGQVLEWEDMVWKRSLRPFAHTTTDPNIWTRHWLLSIAPAATRTLTTSRHTTSHCSKIRMVKQKIWWSRESFYILYDLKTIQRIVLVKA